MNGHASTLRAQLILMLVGITIIIACHTATFGQDLDEVSFSGVVAEYRSA